MKRIGLGIAIGLLLGVGLAYAAISKDVPGVLTVTAAPQFGVANVDLDKTVEAGGIVSGSFDLTNTGGRPITGIGLSQTGLPGLVLAQFSCPGGCGSLGAGETKTVTVQMFTTSDTAAQAHPFVVRVSGN